MRFIPRCGILVLFLISAVKAETTTLLDGEQIEYSHGISYIKPLKYPRQFQHFDYVNPEAPKGGTVRFPELGTFDTFNNILSKGRLVQGYTLLDYHNLLYDRLLEPAIDETTAYYGRLAEGVWVSDDYRKIAFKIRKDARWHDGEPITVDDIVFTFTTYKEKASAYIKTAVRDIDTVEVIGEREVLITTKPGFETNTTLVFTIGRFPILPKHYWQDHDITKTTIVPPLGSGPYKAGEFMLGRYMFFDRVEDYWGKDLPVNKGRYNFGRVKYDYFRDEAIMLEALKADVIDVRHETVSKTWSSEYNFPAVKAGYFKKELVYLTRPWGMWWPTIWNLDQERFRDIRIREALWLLSDFRWFNRVLMYGFYNYGNSFFYNSEMAQRGLPSAHELRLLEPWRGKIPDRVFTEEFKQPQTTGYGYSRDNIKSALQLFEEAGWVVEEGKLVSETTGEQFSVDFIFVSPSLLRGKMPFVDTLTKIGIKTAARSPEVSNWLYRMRNGLFDGGSTNYIPSTTPGFQLRSRFSSDSADMKFSLNWGKIRDPAVDDLIDKIISAEDETSFHAATRALDRVLLWNFYFIPGMAQPGFRLVYWDKFGQPEDQTALLRTAWLDTWWWNEEKSNRVKAGMAELSGDSP